MDRSKYFSKKLESYIKLLISFGFSALMFKFILEGNIGYFINPKLIPMVVFCILALVTTSLVSFIKSNNSNKENKFKLLYLVYIIPIVIGFIVPVRIISLSTFQSGLKSSQSLQDVTTNNGKDIIDSSINEVSNSIHQPKKTKIIINEKNYSIEVDRINMFPTDYQDCETEITGKIYRDKKMKSNEFAIVRPMMTCCSADAALVGLLCIGQSEQSIKEGSWATVKGKINVLTTPNEQKPTITVDNITKAQKPKNEFVYPY